ncbi:hypothetical protein MMC16_004461 [Acarospora aff. strigata]|nr:hypothetical protein [Acarospora aff. strigata]
MFSKLVSLAVFLSLALFAVASPIIQERQDGPGDPYRCNPSVVNRKKFLQSVGANARDLAIAILENGCKMNSDYPFGDVYPAKDGKPAKPKTGDAANFGLFKNNWGQIRRHCSQFKGQSQAQWRNGAFLNTHDVSAIRCQHEQIKALGVDTFFQNQRGVPGEGPDYAKGVDYIKNYLNQGHLTDNFVTFYNLHAV